jgi:MOSC domain-containing protein YiiM
MTDALQALREALSALPPAPTDEGLVDLLVLRPTRGERRVPDSLHLTPEGGIEGDRWGQRSPQDRSRQVSAIRADVARVLAGSAPLEASGDNLLLQFDLSTHNLPPGSVLEIGTARLRITEEAHMPCGLFSQRLGPEAKAITLDAEFQSWRLRGILLEVLSAGVICVGDTVRVGRPSP